MASLAAACRLSARLIHRRAAARSFSASSQHLAAQNFNMPALSPSMTEGKVAGWKVKEGDSFSAGDVLVEIETDKAVLDVEAQDDGIMMKIMQQESLDLVPVGTRLAVIADAGDDIGSLEMPPDEKQAGKPSADKASSAGSDASAAGQQTSAADYKDLGPLLPSVSQLIREKGISREDVGRIQGTGPNGRLLKGDVLAFLGAVEAGRPEAISAHLRRLSHLDLSNIKVAERRPPPPVAEQPEAPRAEVAKTVRVEVPLSLSTVFELQGRLQKKLGIPLDVSELIDRAARIANKDLGPSASRPPTADELFDQILGLEGVNRVTARDHYRPVVSVVTPREERATPKPDIIDILAGLKAVRRQQPSHGLAPGAFGSENVLSLVVPQQDKRRAERFLGHCKAILEIYPQHLLEL